MLIENTYTLKDVFKSVFTIPCNSLIMCNLECRKSVEIVCVMYCMQQRSKLESIANCTVGGR